MLIALGGAAYSMYKVIRVMFVMIVMIVMRVDPVDLSASFSFPALWPVGLSLLWQCRERSRVER